MVERDRAFVLIGQWEEKDERTNGAVNKQSPDMLRDWRVGMADARHVGDMLRFWNGRRHGYSPLLYSWTQQLVARYYVFTVSASHTDGRARWINGMSDTDNIRFC